MRKDDLVGQANRAGGADVLTDGAVSTGLGPRNNSLTLNFTKRFRWTYGDTIAATGTAHVVDLGGPLLLDSHGAALLLAIDRSINHFTYGHIDGRQSN